MATGWVKIHRELTEDALYFSEPFTRMMAWIDLIILANYEPGTVRKRGIVVNLKRGDVGVSQETLAARWKWSRGKILRYLSELETDGKIVQSKNNANCCITIVNYEKYQSDGTQDGTQLDQKTDQRQYRTKKNKEIKKKEFSSANAPALDLKTDEDEKFNQFNEWLQKNAPAVLKMKEPISLQQFQQLQEEFKSPVLKKLLAEKFVEMSNWIKLKDRVSAFLTVKKWAQRDIDKEPERFKLSVALVNPVKSKYETELENDINEAQKHGFQ